MQKPTTTKISIENNYGRYVVEVFQTDLLIEEIGDQLKQLLLAAGYQPENVDNLIDLT